MFGKSLSEYVAFQKPILILIAAVWALRLTLSMAHVPVSGAQLVSVTGVLVVGALYYGWAVGRKGFGSFKQLYGRLAAGVAGAARNPRVGAPRVGLSPCGVVVTRRYEWARPSRARRKQAVAPRVSPPPSATRPR